MFWSFFFFLFFDVVSVSLYVSDCPRQLLCSDEYLKCL
uniref:Uncharacterized protein n=1 Tax=Anguilla anguilla TaxID=7936 RepID=A0A0E9R5I5_ANGAN